MTMPTFARISALTLTLLTLLSAHVVAAPEPRAGRLVKPLAFSAPDCTDRPAFLSETRQEVAGGLAGLPKNVLVAREAQMWVEGKTTEGEDLKIHSFQSFVRPKTRAIGRVLCAHGSPTTMGRYSLVAPTVIDSSLDRRTGHSMWQFQVIAEGQAFSVWNKKSQALSMGPTVEMTLKNLKTPYKLYQLSAKEYELILQKDVGGLSQTLSVRYEAM